MEKKSLQISSRAFPDDGTIPVRYTCDGANVSPPLEIRDIPPRAVSLAVIMDDPGAPIGPWAHWLVWNIPVTHRIRENFSPVATGRNDFGRTRYTGPCPPKGTHRYHFKVYALDGVLELLPGASCDELERAMNGRILASGRLTGLYAENNGRTAVQAEIHQKKT